MRINAMHYTCAEEGRATSGLTHRMQLAVRRLKEQEQLLSEQKTKLDERAEAGRSQTGVGPAAVVSSAVGRRNRNWKSSKR
jgi:hypothetical protein